MQKLVLWALFSPWGALLKQQIPASAKKKKREGSYPSIPTRENWQSSERATRAHHKVLMPETTFALSLSLNLSLSLVAFPCMVIFQ